MGTTTLRVVRASLGTRFRAPVFAEQFSRTTRSVVVPSKSGAAVSGDSQSDDSPPLFHVVLHEPEIPNNTGNIGRTCVATGCALHLIHPLGFETDEKACRRAGLDYWARLRVKEHASWEGYLRDAAPGSVWVFSTKAKRTVFDASLSLGDHLIFGKETAGLPPSILTAFPDRLVSLPMVPGERSLNVATAVCAAVYEGVRQLIGSEAIFLDQAGRLSRRNSEAKRTRGRPEQ